MANIILKTPCPACPYRKDVASGVWADEEYDKLPAYDAETFAQPFQAFACHASPENYCHGWAVCHSNRGHGNELLALRVRGVSVDEVPTPTTELFNSGQEAADHGRREIENPGPMAEHTIHRLLARHERLRK